MSEPRDTIMQMWNDTMDRALHRIIAANPPEDHSESAPFWCYQCAIAKDCSQCSGIAWRPDIPCEHIHRDAGRPSGGRIQRVRDRLSGSPFAALDGEAPLLPEAAPVAESDATGGCNNSGDAAPG